MTEPGDWPAPAGEPFPSGSGAPAETSALGPSGWWQPTEEMLSPAPVGESAPGDAAQSVSAPAGGEPPRSRSIAAAVVAGLLAGVVGGAGAYAVADWAGGEGVATVLPANQPSGELPALKAGSVAAIADAALPSVVSLAVTGKGEGVSGSGFVLRSDGYIATNNHLIQDAIGGGQIVVTFNDGSSVDGEIVGRSASYDLAVVKVARKGLRVAPLGNSNAVRVGDPVVAIGSPLGLTGTVTTGIISAINRPVTTGGSGDQAFISALQTDAAINPGNSG
ncbi:MAG: trypsin-like peptidase domain-containing protein, partial [Candidatus Nanopelagicales bacterium]|nr:trypsin-like peptidase domain-containing protein [Candidatus Nanopelagicales bacterium]